jgi:deoxyribodipyrimidine photo-lyase
VTVAPTIVWFRLDLRLADHIALDWALQRGGPVIPVFVWAPDEEAPWAPGAASRWWLHHSLERLGATIQSRGSRLLIRRGPSAAALLALARETGAAAVTWTRRYEPAVLARDAAVADALRGAGLEAHLAPGALLFEPESIATREARPYQVFTPFWRACLAAPTPAKPLSAPHDLRAPASWPRSESLETLGLLPARDWAEGLRAAWTPGEQGAADRLARLLLELLPDYAEGRDQLGLDQTSRLSPHLHFGEISPRQVWHAARALTRQGGLPGTGRGAEKFLTEVGWREFAHHLLVHFPRTPLEPLRAEFARFPWRDDADALTRWQQGITGYPVVDAAMRELWGSGWMHNRARMLVASFLVKDLLLPWQDGARWFWDTLVDADLASNTLGWQWTAGCGADAAPYFRVFNPVTQGTRFDARGDYVRRWVPALGALPAEVIHQPWDASPLDLAQAGVVIGTNYPARIVDHGDARERALAALATLRAPSPAPETFGPRER